MDERLSVLSSTQFSPARSDSTDLHTPRFSRAARSLSRTLAGNPCACGRPASGAWTGTKIPELRLTVLTLVAFVDLEKKIRECGGNRDSGIDAFLGQNSGEGWLLPETLRLADYGLGHDERAQQPQPVASRLGPRFYDWQLAQGSDKSWRECHLHARNLLGEQGYRELREQGASGREDEAASRGGGPAAEPPAASQQSLFS